MKHSPTGRTHADKLDWHHLAPTSGTVEPSPVLLVDYSAVESRVMLRYAIPREGAALLTSATALFYKRSALRFERDAVRHAGLASRWARKKVSMYTAAAAYDRQKRRIILDAYLIHRRARGLAKLAKYGTHAPWVPLGNLDRLRAAIQPQPVSHVKPRKVFFWRWPWRGTPPRCEWFRANSPHTCSQGWCVGTKAIEKGALYLRIEWATGHPIRLYPTARSIYPTRPICSTCAKLMVYQLPPAPQAQPRTAK